MHSRDALCKESIHVRSQHFPSLLTVVGGCVPQEPKGADMLNDGMTSSPTDNSSDFTALDMVVSGPMR